MADFSLVIDRSKDVFAFAGLNAMSKKWIEQNKIELNLVTMEGAYISDEDSLLPKIKKIMDSDFTIEVWNKKDLKKVPKTTERL
jgi:hypothetical protein